MSNCVIYIRVSSEQQVKNTSLGDQERICREYASKHGWVALRVFQDDGISAKTTDREKFKEMVRFCCDRRNAVKFALFFMIDRFSRETLDYLNTRYELATAGVRMVSATEWFDDSPEGEFIEVIHAARATLDNKRKSLRVRQAMETLSNSGYWVHQAPYGFRPLRDSSGLPILVPHQDFAPAIKHVFNAIAAGQMSSMGALEYLRRAGIKGARSATLFSSRSLHDLLRKEVYCGRVRNSYTRGRSVPARFAGLVSEQIFDLVQARLSGRVPAPARRKVREDFPLRGFVSCRTCSRPLTGSWSRGRSGIYAYYSCPSCARHRIRKEDLEQRFVEILENITVRNTGRLLAFRELVLEEWQAMHGQAISERESATCRVEKLQTQSARLLDKLLDGTISDETYSLRDRAIKVEIAAAQAALRGFDGPQIDLPAVLQFAHDLLRQLAGTWLRLSGQARQWFQAGLFPARLEWNPEGGLGTGVSNHLFSVLEMIPATNGSVAPPTAATWNRTELVHFAVKLQDLQRRIAA